jgi:hypothetical protein
MATLAEATDPQYGERARIMPIGTSLTPTQVTTGTCAGYRRAAPRALAHKRRQNDGRVRRTRYAWARPLLRRRAKMRAATAATELVQPIRLAASQREGFRTSRGGTLALPHPPFPTAAWINRSPRQSRHASDHHAAPLGIHRHPGWLTAGRGTHRLKDLPVWPLSRGAK